MPHTVYNDASFDKHIPFEITVFFPARAWTSDQLPSQVAALWKLCFFPTADSLDSVPYIFETILLYAYSLPANQENQWVVYIYDVHFASYGNECGRRLSR